MILNETYNEILSRLNTYSLNEGFIGDAIEANKLVSECMKAIESKIVENINDCKRCSVGVDTNYTNVFIVSITLSNKYDKGILEKYKRAALNIIYPIITEYNNRFKKFRKSLQYNIRFSRSVDSLFSKSNHVNLRYVYY